MTSRLRIAIFSFERKVELLAYYLALTPAAHHTPRARLRAMRGGALALVTAP